jgi:uncharacterized cupin superfamily protein
MGCPRHLHHQQDEWLYVVAGELVLEIGEHRFRAQAGESVFIPRKTPHVWTCVGSQPAKIVNVYQPAGKIEQFFQQAAKRVKELPTVDDVQNNTYTEQHVKTLHELFSAHDMDLLGPPLVVE